MSSDFSTKKSTICKRPNSPNLLATRVADAGTAPVSDGLYGFLKVKMSFEGKGVAPQEWSELRIQRKKSTICERPNSPNLLAPRFADAGAAPVSDGPYGFLKACSEFEGIQLLQRRGGLY